MKMMKNWKRFWTLDRHHAEGFTLVELIVVIAILAILAGVAVPAYSGYIAEANKAADRTLIRDIEQALMMGYYQGLIEQNGKVVLSTSGVTPVDFDESAVDGANVKGAGAALRAAFGADYEEKLMLKYDSWSINGAIVGLAEAKDVYNSSYYKSADKLMGQVEDITRAAIRLVENVSGTNNREQMISMFDSEMLDGLAGQYGYTGIDDVSDAELPNLLVLAIATDVTVSNISGEAPSSEATGLIQNFALYNGYAAQNEDFANDYQAFVDAISTANDVDGVAAAYRTLQTATEKYDGWDEYKEGEQSKTDSAAFAAMMSGMVGAADANKDKIKAGLGQSDFFTAGLGNELFNDYMTSVEAMVGLPQEFAEELSNLAQNGHEGTVYVFYTVNQGKISVGNTLPVG